MAKKTFKIGEYCAGGIIEAVVKNGEIKVVQKQWDYSKGTRKSSSQTHAQEIDEVKIDMDRWDKDYRTLSNFLLNITTSYYTDVVMEWIEGRVGSPSKAWW
jgi:hypothetical protein